MKRPARRAAPKLTAKKKSGKPRPRRTQRPEAMQSVSDSTAEVKPEGTPPLHIAGIGASAGGLEAFSQVLENLPPNPGLALILVQHLAPQHESALTTLLSARAPLPVVQATDNMVIEKDHVYVTPPNAQLSVQDRTLQLLPRPIDRTQYTPIDTFLNALAASAQDCSIAVILSGTASDGTAGVRDVKAVGGITIAQKPDTAKYDGMPRAAIASGFVDLVLTPAEIASELVSIVSHPLKRVASLDAGDAVTKPASASHEQQMDQIFAMLRSASGVDFRRYKRPTIDRRLHRRLVLHKLTRLDQYIRFMRDNPGEVHALYSDILIHVTRFFRDRDTLKAVATQVLPPILESQDDEQPIRVWVPGCSTGEEAYSLAMIIFDALGDRGRGAQVQVFATDISDPAIEFARAGLYPQTINKDVTPDELRRYFTATEGGYRINKSIRDACIFARQDLTRDPPFSKLDIILCRNVLIYMGPELQKRLMSIFHYALKPVGFLILGSAETVGTSAEQFSVVDRKLRIYQKRVGSVADLHFPLGQIDRSAVAALDRQRHPQATAQDGRRIEQEASRIVQDRYAPPGVIVDVNGNIVQFRGQTGPYLEPAPGEPNTNLLKMAREGLLHPLRDGLQQARKSRGTVRKGDVRVRANGGWRNLSIEIVPLHDRQHWVVLFEDAQKASRRRAAKAADAEPGAGEPVRRRIASLQQELATSREYLQSIIQDLESANEELQSANEEVLSANEELQSTNEELDTAKEELQSTNEELNTVNEELHGRNDELSRVNSDLVNLLSSVQIPIVIVASDLCIRRFTPAAERMLNLIPGDIGRPITHIKPNIDCPDLEALIAQVVDTVTPTERTVRDQHGAVFSLRIRPYKNLENRIEGAVLAMFPASENGASEPLRAVAVAVADAVPEPLALLDGELRVISINRAFVEEFGVDAAAAVQRPYASLGDGEWSDAGLRRVLERQLSPGASGEEIEYEYDSEQDGRQRIRVTARRIAGTEASDTTIILAPRRPQRGR